MPTNISCFLEIVQVNAATAERNAVNFSQPETDKQHYGRYHYPIHVCYLLYEFTHSISYAGMILALT
jgi:hypothetical protein